MPKFYHPTDDCRVKLMWDHEIEEVAEQVRRRLPSWDEPAQPIWSLLDAFANQVVGGLEIAILPDSAMGRAKAFKSEDGRKLNIRSSVAQLAQSNTTEARFDIAHELGHLTLHRDQIPMFRMIDGNLKQPKLPPHESSEHQANIFARAFLLPSWMIGDAPDAAQLSTTVNMTLANTVTRLETWSNRQEKLARIARSRSGVCSAQIAPQTTRAERGLELERLAWESSLHAPGYDPAHFRLSRGGFLIKRSDRYKRSSPYGWFLEGTQIISTLELLTN